MESGVLAYFQSSHSMHIIFSRIGGTGAVYQGEIRRRCSLVRLRYSGSWSFS